MTRDVVCGMEIEKMDLKDVYRGKTFYFCSKQCLQSFNEDPEKFLK